jgi:hypothetical protein
MIAKAWKKNASDLLVVVAEYPQIVSITTGVPIGINARCLFLNLLCELAVLLILERSDWLMKFAVVQRKTGQTIPSRFPKGWIEQWENKESQSAQLRMMMMMTMTTPAKPSLAR